MNGPLVQDYLDHSAALYPQKTAVTDGRTGLTFGELAEASDRLAGLLRTQGVSRGDRVIYFLKRSPDCITATMGILKAAAAYVPLDQKTPPERWNKIVADATPIAIICSGLTLPEALNRTAALEPCPKIICLSPRAGESTPAGRVLFLEDFTSSLPIATHCEPDDAAYVLYTSGSTGVPKGVMVTHANIRNYIDWALSYFRVTEADHLLGTAPFYFDMSTFDIFTALAAGATLSLATDETLLFPEKLVRYMEQEQITLWKGVSSLLMYMCRAGVIRPGRLASLRTIIFAGESLDAKYLIQWMEAFPEKSFYNGYGPTEATGVSLCYHVSEPPQAGEPIPIGKPCKGAKAVLVDDEEHLVGEGELGELCIAGECLAKGYLNDPEKTASRFTRAPAGSGIKDRVYHTGDLCRRNAAGDYVFVSRKDYQVKWMGYRIELNEIELNLAAHPQVRGAVVLLAGTGTTGLTELTAFFEAEERLDASVLVKFLEARLPGYMIPKKFIQIEALPRNDRGKIAREDVLNAYLAGAADVRTSG